ncbi:TetR/AcrR family transcriptional regulator [Halothermothrix orenii]|uniref:Transcriptional regulator, TetR family n=1 Tax=Halothermothrix orenii (strain H 168 / OCM 544 / DSM 9562) TaxID=373903 RepID=B8CXT4_HALOH|nr:TetR/AcrR family transcriptional regulator [Halothermothrix orenii]ACL70103.1 transcriptional regulator, TetR family [Halothermothrix orenii H 168]
MSKEKTSKAILTAALKLFSKKGYSNVTTKEISEKAGVNEVTIFRHFKSKEKLFEEVFEQFIFKPNIPDVNALNNKNPKEFLLCMAHSLYEIFKYNLSLIKIELKNEETSIDKMRLPLDKFANEIKDIIIDYLKKNKEINISQPDIFTINFLSAVWGLFMNNHIIRPFKPAIDFNTCIEKLITDLLE